MSIESVGFGVPVFTFMPKCPVCGMRDDVTAVHPHAPTSSYDWYYQCSGRRRHPLLKEGEEYVRRNVHFRTRADLKPLTRFE